MATSGRSAGRIHPAWYLFWFAFLIACLYFLADSVGDVAEPELQAGSTLWNRIVWYVGHALIASPILLIAPLQFLPGLRQTRPDVHRWMGRVFLASCMVAGLLGVYLGATLYLPGSRIPLTLLGSCGSRSPPLPGRRRVGGTSSTTGSSPSAHSPLALHSSGCA
jgi:hypothetical protein